MLHIGYISLRIAVRLYTNKDWRNIYTLRRPAQRGTLLHSSHVSRSSRVPANSVLLLVYTWLNYVLFSFQFLFIYHVRVWQTIACCRKPHREIAVRSAPSQRNQFPGLGEVWPATLKTLAHIEFLPKLILKKRKILHDKYDITLLMRNKTASYWTCARVRL
jgi:hypothetical protein